MAMITMPMIITTQLLNYLAVKTPNHLAVKMLIPQALPSVPLPPSLPEAEASLVRGALGT
ncbi:hypothetical protein [Vulcanisaeta distributa]|uniref:hypothetical protein n=1 Tax=Vulcanisaeta distributa TaxID=164451 RepID=UPI0011E587C1|nr:hypothetical protein [Vulcanisaeta distributa]